MVAEVAVSVLLVKLQNLLDDERVMLPGLRSRVLTAVNELKQILSLLEAANANQGNAIVSHLEARLLHTIYSTDYVTENFLLLRVERRPKGVNKIIQMPLMAFSTQRQLRFSYQMKKFIKSIRAICSNFSEIHSFRGHQYDQAPEVLVGREDVEKELLALLFDNNEQSLRVISLVSEKPLGKTALARTIYNRLDIRRHFHYHAWLHVPKEFAYKDLLLIIIKQIPMPPELKDVEIMSEGSVFDLLFQILMEVRFIIVLDDVCTLDDWHELFYPLADSQNGSRIILTTCHSYVAALADPWSRSLKLKPLNDNESWGLFLKKVRGSKVSSDNTVSNNLKAEVLRICCGLPPAITLLAGMLSTIDLSEWSRVIDLVHSENQSTLLDIVALSHHKLPSVLQPCFLYFTLFPKGYEIPTRRLLQLWLAEGFIQMSSQVCDAPEDVAKIYLKELVCRNMIEIARWKPDGTPKTCRMPCFLYDAFLPKAEATGFLHIHHVHCKPDCKSSSKFRIQRLIDQYSVVKSTSESHIQHLRSYVSFEAQKGDTSNQNIGIFLKTIVNSRGFTMLKVLDLEGIYKPSLDEKIGLLQNLRYIGLRWTALGSCPKSIGDLPCLETLDLKYTNIITLPSSIWKAKNLRHLYMNEVSIEKPSKECSTNLQSLTGLHIGSKDPQIYGLDRCTNLRKLGLTYHSGSDMKTANCISQLTNLQTLRLRSRDRFGQPLDLKLSPMKDHQSLSNLHLFGVIKDGIRVRDLPWNLQILTLSVTKLKEDPMPELGRLPKLKTLRLFSCSYAGSKMKSPRGHFPELRVFKLWKLEKLEKWTVEEDSMPQLLELEIRSCKELKTLDGLQLLHALKELILTNMPEDFASELKKQIDVNKILTNKWQSSNQAKLVLMDAGVGDKMQSGVKS
ncbi:hypothetical protein ACB092_11G000800 [Castanea dentata]